MSGFVQSIRSPKGAAAAFGLWCSALIGLAGPASACDKVIRGLDINKPIQVEATCAFRNAGQTTKRPSHNGKFLPKSMSSDNTRGAATLDRTQGIVTQVISQSSVCSRVQQMLILDCNAGSAIAIQGVADPKVAHSSVTEDAARYAVGPQGRIRFQRGETLPDFTVNARKAGLKVTTDVRSLQAGWKSNDKYDPFCGCKLHYPVSAGAKK